MIDHSIHHPMIGKSKEDWQTCGTCDRHLSVHPDKMDYLAKHEMEVIIEKGHFVQQVFGDEMPFSYSVGRSVKDRPEILVTGPLSPQVQGYIVNRVADIDDERGVTAGDVLDDVLDGYPVRIVEVTDLEWASMFGATQHFMDATAIQVVWPDMEGHFPDDPDFDERFNQPIYNETHGGFLGHFRDCQQCGSPILCKIEDELGPKTCEEHTG